MSGIYPIILLQENNQERNEGDNNLNANCAITTAVFK